MSHHEKAKQIISEAVDSINARLQLRGAEKILKTENEILLGEGGRLNSLSLVHFTVAVEEKTEALTGRAIILVDDRAMSQKEQPLETIGSLIRYIELLLSEHENA